MSYAIKPFGLRLPPDLKEWIHAQAKRNRASQNTEIVRRLRDSRDREEQHKAVAKQSA